MDNKVEINENIKTNINILIMFNLNAIYPYMKYLYSRSNKREDAKTFVHSLQNKILLKTFEYCINPRKMFIEINQENITKMLIENKKGNEKSQIMESNTIKIIQAKLLLISIINKSQHKNKIEFSNFNKFVDPKKDSSDIHSFIDKDLYLKFDINKINLEKKMDDADNINIDIQHEIFLNKDSVNPKKLMIEITGMKYYFKTIADNILKDTAKNKWNKVVNRFVNMAEPKNKESEGYTAMSKDYYNVNSSTVLNALSDDESFGSFYNASKNKRKSKKDIKGLKQKSLTRDAYINKTKEEINIENIDNKRKLNMVDTYININMNKNAAEIIHLTKLGWSDKDISEELNIKSATVRTIKSRAIKELRKNIGKLN